MSSAAAGTGCTIKYVPSTDVVLECDEKGDVARWTYAMDHKKRDTRWIGPGDVGFDEVVKAYRHLVEHLPSWIVTDPVGIL